MSTALLGNLYMNGVKVLGLLSLTLFLAVACNGESPMAVPTDTPNPEVKGQATVVSSPPMATPTAAQDIDAMVEARVAAAIAAMLTPTAPPVPTPLPTAKPRPTTTPTPIPTAAPSPAPTAIQDIDATVEARVAAAITAMLAPTATSVPTPLPTATPRPTTTPTPIPTATPSPTLTPTPTPIPTAIPHPTPTPTPTLNQVVVRLEPAVVQIFAPTVTGSGLFFNANGWVVTNAHVVNGHPNVTVVTDEGTRLQGQVVGLNDFVDLAVLKTNITSPVSYPTWAHPSTIKVGDDAIALGFPLGSLLGSSMSVSEGIVSAIRDEPGVKYLQTSAAINPGNSGGPLINGRGQVVGINTLRITESGGSSIQNINFAISSGTVQDWLPDLTAGVWIRDTTVNLLAGRSYEIRLYVEQGWEIGYSWKVFDESEDGSLDVNFGLYDPVGIQLTGHKREASSEGAFVVDVSGFYSLEFDNEFSLFTSKDISVAYWRLPPR